MVRIVAVGPTPGGDPMSAPMGPGGERADGTDTGWSDAGHAGTRAAPGNEGSGKGKVPGKQLPTSLSSPMGIHGSASPPWLDTSLCSSVVSFEPRVYNSRPPSPGAGVKKGPGGRQSASQNVRVGIRIRRQRKRVMKSGW